MITLLLAAPLLLGQAPAEELTLPLEREACALIVTVAGEELRHEGAVVGVVWLCAGQSNMDFGLSRAEGGKVAAGAAGELSLRLCDRTGSRGGGPLRIADDPLAGMQTASKPGEESKLTEWSVLGPCQASSL